MAAKILLKEKQEVEVVVSQYDELLLLIAEKEFFSKILHASTGKKVFMTL